MIIVSLYHGLEAKTPSRTLVSQLNRAGLNLMPSFLCNTRTGTQWLHARVIEPINTLRKSSIPHSKDL